MIFRAYASKNPGVWGEPQGALVAQRQNNGNRKFTIFAILLLTKIKTVADTFVPDSMASCTSILHLNCIKINFLFQIVIAWDFAKVVWGNLVWSKMHKAAIVLKKGHVFKRLSCRCGVIDGK